jgi:hypothetical protein
MSRILTGRLTRTRCGLGTKKGLHQAVSAHAVARVLRIPGPQVGQGLGLAGLELRQERPRVSGQALDDPAAADALPLHLEPVPHGLQLLDYLRDVTHGTASGS